MGIHRSTDNKNTIGYLLLISQKQIEAYVKYENDILIEYNIVKVISFNGYTYGTTYVLVDAAKLVVKRASKKKKSTSELEQKKHMDYAGRKICW